MSANALLLHPGGELGDTMISRRDSRSRYTNESRQTPLLMRRNHCRCTYKKSPDGPAHTCPNAPNGSCAEDRVLFSQTAETWSSSSDLSSVTTVATASCSIPTSVPTKSSLALFSSRKLVSNT